MKVRLEEHPGGSNSKLACVKRVKELTGRGLKESKEIVDVCCHGGGYVEFEVYCSRVDIERMKYEFDIWGFKLTGVRTEVLDDLLGDDYKYIIEFLQRDVTYRVEEGDYTVVDDLYIINIEVGARLDGHDEKSCNDRKITIPKNAVAIEENIMMND